MGGGSLLEFHPVWFDSMGAKSSATLVVTPDLKILIDPGIAAMQPGFPASPEEKMKWREEGKGAILNAMKEASLVVLSHYHYDHFLPNEIESYRGKRLFIKNPNEYINLSQRERALELFKKLVEFYGAGELSDYLGEEERDFKDPMEELRLAREKDYGDYSNRKKELLSKGKMWFEKLKEAWRKWPKVPELRFRDLSVEFPEGRTYRFGKTTIRFRGPLFHGVEYSRVGWVFATVVEVGGRKLIHTSDLNGPVIEDYAQWLIDENPDILIVDGPMTYMLGYMLNKINLMRAVENMVRIVEAVDASIIIYDHHLPREPRYIEHTERVWEVAKKRKKRVETAAEFLGRKPKVIEITALK
jgi:hypothetical protein